MEGPDRPLFPEGVPMGLGMAMLQYPGAMEKYGALEEEAQRQLIEDAKGIPLQRGNAALCGAFRHRRRITPRPRHPPAAATHGPTPRSHCSDLSCFSKVSEEPCVRLWKALRIRPTRVGTRTMFPPGGHIGPPLR